MSAPLSNVEGADHNKADLMNLKSENYPQIKGYGEYPICGNSTNPTCSKSMSRSSLWVLSLNLQFGYEEAIKTAEDFTHAKIKEAIIKPMNKLLEPRVHLVINYIWRECPTDLKKMIVVHLRCPT